MGCEPGRRNGHYVVVEPVLLHRRARARRLVEVGIVKGDGEGLHGSAGQLSGLGRDRPRVQSA